MQKKIFAYGYSIKKVHNILLYDAWQFYVKKKDGGQIKICETFSGNSLKEDLSIYTTFDPCYFLWDSPFKYLAFWNFDDLGTCSVQCL